MDEPQTDPVEPTEPDAPVEGGEPEAFAVTPEQWQQTQEQLAQQQQYLEQIAQAIQGGQQQPQLDPFADNFQAQLDQWASEKFSGYDAYIEQQNLERGAALASQMLDEASSKAEFLDEGSREKVEILANQYVGDPTQASIKDVEAAIAKAVDEVKAWEQEVGKKYYERELQQIRGITNARQEPGAAQTGAAQQLTVTPGGPNAVLRKYTQSGQQ